MKKCKEFGTGVNWLKRNAPMTDFSQQISRLATRRSNKIPSERPSQGRPIQPTSPTPKVEHSHRECGSTCVSKSMSTIQQFGPFAARLERHSRCEFSTKDVACIFLAQRIVKRSFSNLRLTSLIESHRDRWPIDDAPPTIDVIRSSILVSQVIRVFPHIQSEQRHGSRHQRTVLIGSVRNL